MVSNHVPVSPACYPQISPSSPCPCSPDTGCRSCCLLPPGGGGGAPPCHIVASGAPHFIIITISRRSGAQEQPHIPLKEVSAAPCPGSWKQRQARRGQGDQFTSVTVTGKLDIRSLVMTHSHSHSFTISGASYKISWSCSFVCLPSAASLCDDVAG